MLKSSWVIPSADELVELISLFFANNSCVYDSYFGVIKKNE